jgi:hypothetical protein
MARAMSVPTADGFSDRDKRQKASMFTGKRRRQACTAIDKLLIARWHPANRLALM